MIKEYVLINGKTVSLGRVEQDRKLVTFIGDNSATASRVYGYYCPKQNMTYGVSVTIHGSMYTYEFKNIVSAEGFAILGAFAKDKNELDSYFGMGEQILFGYAINTNTMCVMEQIANKSEF